MVAEFPTKPHMQAVLHDGAEHLRRGVAVHETAAAVVNGLRQLQRNAADRPPCWAQLWR